jgi:hypothetical protein
MCQHQTCIRITEDLTALGVEKLPGVFGIICCDLHFPKALLGRGRKGESAKYLNLPGGGMDKEDKGCYLQTLLRELGEEIKCFGTWDHLDTVFKYEAKRGEGARFHYRIHKSMDGRCSVGFIGLYQGDSSKLVADCNLRIAAANRDKRNSHCQRELAYVELYSLETTNSAPISRFAQAMFQKI